LFTSLTLKPTKTTTGFTIEVVKLLNFMDELKPILEAFALQPIAFLGGLFAGFLRLDENQEPLKSWLSQQGVAPSPAPAENDKRPQSISIE